MFKFAFLNALLIIQFQLSCINATNENVKQHKGHLKKFGSSGPYVRIDEVSYDKLSTKQFFEHYVSKKQPVLILNQAKQFPAIDLWSNDMYLYEKGLNYDENYQVNVETVKKESRDQYVKGMTFLQFLEDYQKEDIYMVSTVPEFLKSELVLPNVLQCGSAPSTLQKTVIIIKNIFKI